MSQPTPQPTPQTTFPVYLHRTVKRKLLERHQIPEVITPALRRVWGALVVEIALRGFSGPLTGVIGTGKHIAKLGYPQVKLSIFDGLNVKIATFAVYYEVEQYAVKFLEPGDRHWMNIGGLRQGLVVSIV